MAGKRRMKRVREEQKKMMVVSNSSMASRAKREEFEILILTMYDPVVVRLSAPITTPPSNATAIIEVYHRDES